MSHADQVTLMALVLVAAMACILVPPALALGQCLADEVRHLYRVIIARYGW